MEYVCKKEALILLQQGSMGVGSSIEMFQSGPVPRGTAPQACTCAAGYYCPVGSRTAAGIQCPRGSFCTGGTANAIECTVGTFCPLGASAKTNCTCAGGYYCPAGSITSAGKACPAGTYCSGGTADAVPCGARTFSLGGRATCSPCPFIVSTLGGYSFTAPAAVAADSAGNLYIVNSNRILLYLAAQDRIVPYAGGGYMTDGTFSLTQAGFSTPTGIAINSTGTYIYIAETGLNIIRRINTGPRTVTSLFSPPSTPLSGPEGVAVDSAGNLYITDTGNHRIMRYSTSGALTTFAGSTSGYADATGAAAKFNTPTGIAVNSAGIIHVADTGNNLIRKITSAGVVSTFVPASAGLNAPRGITLDSAGVLYIADTGNSLIRKVSPTGVVSTLAGTTAGYIDEPGATAAFTEPQGVAVDSSGTVYVADTGNYTMRKIANICDPTTGL